MVMSTAAQAPSVKYAHRLAKKAKLPRDKVQPMRLDFATESLCCSPCEHNLPYTPSAHLQTSANTLVHLEPTCLGHSQGQQQSKHPWFA
jgi:hypothetical protein